MMYLRNMIFITFPESNVFFRLFHRIYPVHIYTQTDTSSVSWDTKFTFSFHIPNSEANTSKKSFLPF